MTKETDASPEFFKKSLDDNAQLCRSNDDAQAHIAKVVRGKILGIIDKYNDDMWDAKTGKLKADYVNPLRGNSYTLTGN